jgi:hypothetical protein
MQATQSVVFVSGIGLVCDTVRVLGQLPNQAAVCARAFDCGT